MLDVPKMCFLNFLFTFSVFWDRKCSAQYIYSKRRWENGEPVVNYKNLKKTRNYSKELELKPLDNFKSLKFFIWFRMRRV